MKKEELKEVLMNGFNAALLADALHCSIGRINELKSEPVEGQIYHKADINSDAIYDFAQKHEIDLDNIDFAPIVAKKEAKAQKVALKVGDNTKFGKIIAIQKVGNAFVYLINNNGEMVIKSTKEMSL